MKQPRKHAELIKAWADGAEIQCRHPDIQPDWQIIYNPSWLKNWEYRIKLEDVVKYGCTTWLKAMGSNERRHDDSCSFTFDGETGGLKAIEILESK